MGATRHHWLQLRFKRGMERKRNCVPGKMELFYCPCLRYKHLLLYINMTQGLLQNSRYLPTRFVVRQNKVYFKICILLQDLFCF